MKPDGTLVPWLATEGPLAYSPENPPTSSYFFQYGWLMPRVYSDRRHYYFGTPSSLSRREVDWSIQPFVDFWSKAQAGAVARIYVREGERHADRFTSPIACYRYQTDFENRDTYVLIQHGSYLTIDVAEQPFLKDGLLVLFRGVGNKTSFSWRDWDGDLSPDESAILQRYFEVQERAFSDSEVSFQVAHAGVYRCETGFVQWKISWTDLAREIGFDPEKNSPGRQLTSAYQQSFTLLELTAAWKFGPNYVKCTTPVNNVRITSFFAGESEVRVIDPRKVEIVAPRLDTSTYRTLCRLNVGQVKRPSFSGSDGKWGFSAESSF